MVATTKTSLVFAVVETAVGQMFCYRSADASGAQYTLMADELCLDAGFDFIRFDITSTTGAKRTFYTVSNAYDPSIMFSPRYSWFTEGKVPSLRADMFEAGDQFTVSIMYWFTPKPGFAEKLWLLMTGWRGTRDLINWPATKSELVALKQTA